MSNSKLKTTELQGKSISELKNELFLLKKELFNLRFQQVAGELKNFSRFCLVRKNVARVKTEIARRLKIKG